MNLQIPDDCYCDEKIGVCEPCKATLYATPPSDGVEFDLADYRQMLPNEVICEGDKFYGADPPGDEPRFHDALSIGFTPSHSVHGYRYFRPVKNDDKLPAPDIEAVLAEALEELVEWQNGPSLSTIKWTTGWNGAMEKARAALALRRKAGE